MVSPRPPSGRDIFFQNDGLRRSIIASYWTVILFAVPLWWYATSIERLSLPSARVEDQTNNRLELPITICLQTKDSHSVRVLEQAISGRMSSDPDRWRGIAVDVKAASDCANSDVYTVIPRHGTPSIHNRNLYHPMDDASSLSKLADTLTQLLVPDPDRRVAQYSSRYRLAFSLLNEDVAAGAAVVGWDIQSALKGHISPILRRLDALHNFTVESQVQFHAPLAFSPHQHEDKYAISPEDLTVFVNSAEWTLSSSSSNDPVLHFVLFIPSAQRRPLRILTDDNSVSPSTAFLLPQWGGIVIHNPGLSVNGHLGPEELTSIFSSFANQLLGLLGVPKLPPNVKRSSFDSAAILSDWQLDALLRRRALENASGSQDTLRSIVKLVAEIENMPVGSEVRDDVENALEALTKMYDASRISLRDTFTYSARSSGLASRAFFSPGMLALLYFPAEHKYGVYIPLFAAALIPPLITALRELKAWRKEVGERKRSGRSPPKEHDQ